jgi:hypothetical protein
MVMSMTGTITSATAMLQLLESDLKFGQAMLSMDPRLEEMPPTWRMNTVKTAAVAKQWRAQGRQTLSMHPEIAAATKLATSDKIPVEVLRALPYICPMVVFPDPPLMPTWRGYANAGNGELMPYAETWMRMLGFLTYSFDPVLTREAYDGPQSPTRDLLEATNRMVRSTHDPDTRDFGAIVIFEILDETGKRVDMEAASISTPFAQVATLAELVEDQAQRFVFADIESGRPELQRLKQITQQITESLADKKRVKSWFEEVFKTVMGSLLYLCSTTLEAERVPSSATRKLAKNTIARKPLSLYRIGWTTGAALSTLRQERMMLGEPSQMGDLAHQQDPQHRRAHFKTVWSGPGRTIPKTVFVAPYWTHRERLGVVGVNTARRVV